MEIRIREKEIQTTTKSCVAVRGKKSAPQCCFRDMPTGEHRNTEREKELFVAGLWWKRTLPLDSSPSSLLCNCLWYWSWLWKVRVVLENSWNNENIHLGCLRFICHMHCRTRALCCIVIHDSTGNTSYLLLPLASSAAGVLRSSPSCCLGCRVSECLC